MKSTTFIILSYAKDERTKLLTINCIISLIQSQSYSRDKFNILIVETNEHESWEIMKPAIHVLHPKEPFNYNRFANLGYKYLKSIGIESDYVCLCNNDLKFHPNWHSKIIEHDIDSMSPLCSLTLSNRFQQGVVFGYQTAYQLNGWCLFLKKETYQKIGGFDEDFSFWCADDSYREQLIQHNLRHAIVCDSIVDHLDNGSNTVKTLDSETMERYTQANLQKYREKFNRS